MSPAGLCEELRTLIGYNVLEDLNLNVELEGNEADDVVMVYVQTSFLPTLSPSFRMSSRDATRLQEKYLPHPESAILSMVTKIFLTLVL